MISSTAASTIDRLCSINHSDTSSSLVSSGRRGPRRQRRWMRCGERPLEPWVPEWIPKPLQRAQAHLPQRPRHSLNTDVAISGSCNSEAAREKKRSREDYGKRCKILTRSFVHIQHLGGVFDWNQLIAPISLIREIEFRKIALTFEQRVQIGLKRKSLVDHKNPSRKGLFTKSGARIS